MGYCLIQINLCSKKVKICNLQMGSWENWQLPANHENSYQGQLFHSSTVPGLEKKPECDLVPSFPYSDWQAKSI